MASGVVSRLRRPRLPSDASRAPSNARQASAGRKALIALSPSSIGAAERISAAATAWPRPAPVVLSRSDESPGLGKGGRVATDRTVAPPPGGGHQSRPGPPARVEERHCNDRRHDLQDATIISCRSREVLEAIRIPSHGSFEEGEGVE